MERGDIVVVDGNGYCVVEGLCVQNGTVTADLRVFRGDLVVVRGVPETEAELIRRVPRREPAPGSAPGIARACQIDPKSKWG